MIILMVIPMVLGPVIALTAVLYICLVMIPGDQRRALRRSHIDKARHYIRVNRLDLARIEIKRAERLF